MATLLLALTLSGRLCAQEAGSLGAGVVLGDPTGLTGKYWFDRGFALDFGVGFSGDAAFYADLLWHSWELFPQPRQGKLGAYAGLGPRVETERDAVLGLRTILGLAYWLPRHPIELFAEGGPVFRLTPDHDVDTDLGLGMRFYFGGK